MNRRTMKRISFTAFMLVSLAFLVTGASASILSIEDGEVNAIGTTASLNLTLDSAPAGLSGYSINISLGNPSVATIATVTFPSWAYPASVTPTLPSSSCRITGLDPYENVQDGATDIQLATVTVEGLNEGVTPVTLTVNLMSDDDDNDIIPTIIPGTFTVNTSGALTAAFTSNKTVGNVPLTVQFTDLSLGSPTSWAWDFQNDGSTDSTVQNPVFTYGAAGIYSVKLTATNGGGSDDEVKTNYINVTTAPPDANFTANKTSGKAPLIVQFTDLSTGSPTSWAWDFQDDGTTDSTTQNPVFTYTDAGLYTVRLTATNAGGSNAETRTNYISVAVAPPVPDFTANKTSGNYPLTVQFTDLSTGSPATWDWDFQDDGVIDSHDKNPVFTYSTPGNYSVRLMVGNAGGSDYLVREDYITVSYNAPVANFTANTMSGYVPLTVQFTDLSTGIPTSWAWDFENDGTTDSTAKNPEYTYPTAGNYTVKLTVTNPSGSTSEIKTDYIRVLPPPPVAQFTANKTAGNAPLTVQFTDLSTGSPTSWAWDFQNDGIMDSTAKNPVFTYATPGLYSVKLTATNAGGSDVETKTSYINVTTVPPVANFTANKTAGDAPLTVQFTDLSTGSPTSWAWDFQNDGITDTTTQNPVFTYPTAGTFTVKLTATNAGGSDPEIKTNYITVTVAPPVANFTANKTSGGVPLTVQFTDLSTGSPASWAWDFQNDGIMDSTLQNPVYTYPAPGTYTVNLTATNTKGSDSEVKTGYITVTSGPSLSLTSPNGGEVWKQGSSQTFTWTHSGDLGSTVKIEILKGTSPLATLKSDAPIGSGGSGSYTFTFPYYTPLATDYYIRVTSNANPAYSDTSEGAFSIASAITVVSPNGGENWQPGSTQTLRWNYTGSPGDTVKIEALRSGSVLATVSSSYPIGSGGSGSYDLPFPLATPLGTDYQIRVTSTSNPACTDMSDGYFSISRLPSITVTSPNGGETWPQNSSQTIQWSYTEHPGSMVRIELLKGAAVQQVITPGTSIGSGGLGSYPLTISSGLPFGDDYTIRITSASNASYTDTSNAPFTISEPTSIRVVRPEGGSVLYRGDPLVMNWSYTGNPGSTVTIEVFKGVQKMATLQNIPVGSGGNGSYAVPAIPSGTPVGSDYTIKVTSTLYPTVTDTGDPFAISGPTLRVESPNGGETFPIGGPLAMSWSYAGNPGSTVTIEVFKGIQKMATLQNIPLGSGGNGSYSVPGIPSGTPVGSDYTIAVTSTLYPTCTDTSDGMFAISTA